MLKRNPQFHVHSVTGGSRIRLEKGRLRRNGHEASFGAKLGDGGGVANQMFRAGDVLVWNSWIPTTFTVLHTRGASFVFGRHEA